MQAAHPRGEKVAVLGAARQGILFYRGVQQYVGHVELGGRGGRLVRVALPPEAAQTLGRAPLLLGASQAGAVQFGLERKESPRQLLKFGRESRQALPGPELALKVERRFAPRDLSNLGAL